MSNQWIGEDSKGPSAPALSKAEKYLTSGKFLELEPIYDIAVRAKQGTSRRSNTKAEGCILSVSLVASPGSEITKKSMRRLRFSPREQF